MNLLVTGGCGFIGANFIRQVLAGGSGLEVGRLVNLDLLTYAGNPANLADISGGGRHVFVKGDIGDRDLVGRLLAEHDIDAVVNFAAETHVDRSIDSPEPFVRTNVLGTLRLLDGVRARWSGLPAARREAFRFLHVSTDEVYGTLGPADPAFTETSRFQPNSPYAASKAAGDHLVRACHHTYGLPVITSNCSNNYGPFQFPEKMIPLMILNCLEGRPLPVYGDGMQVRDWLYVGDHCTAIARVLASGRPGETYNIGGLNEQTNIGVVRRICRLMDGLRPRADGTPHENLISFVTDRPGHDRRYAIDCAKISRELGWRPSESFDTGLRRTVDWYLANGAWVDDITRTRYGRERLGMIPGKGQKAKGKGQKARGEGPGGGGPGDS